MLSFITLGTLWKICLRCSKIYIKIYMCIRLCICTVYMYMNMYKKWLLRLSFHNSRQMTEKPQFWLTSSCASLHLHLLQAFHENVGNQNLTFRQDKFMYLSRSLTISKQTNKKTIDLFTDTAAVLILPTGHPIILD